MNRKIITKSQLRAIVNIYTIGTSIIIISSTLSLQAKQDAWITPIIVCLLGLPVIAVYISISKSYEGKTLSDILENVFGKIIGKIIELNFAFMCILDASEVSWYIGRFFTTQFMPETPFFPIIAMFVVVLMIAVSYDIETIGRAAQIFELLVIVMLLFSMVLVTPKVEINNILPILENGFTPVLKASIFLLSYMVSPLVVLLYIYPANIHINKENNRAFYLGFIFASAIIFITNIMTILVLGSNISSNSIYPTYLLVKEIDIATIFSRIEGVIAALWIITIFYRALFYFYAGAICISRLFGLKDYKQNVLPLGLIISILSLIVYPNSFYEQEWDSYTWIPYIGTFALILPLVMWIILYIRKILTKYKA